MALQGGGLVTFNCGAGQHVIGAGPFTIEANTTIRGGNRIILGGANAHKFFIVNNNATLTLNDIILRNGRSSSGGCIAVNVDATLVTNHVTFEGCRDTSMILGGGAVYNLGTFRALHTSFVENQAARDGGAVFNRGRFEADFVEFEANRAGEDSGAIENDVEGIVVIEDSLFLGNTAQVSGGAIGNSPSGGLAENDPLVPEAEGSITVARSLFIDNSSITSGGAINHTIGDLRIDNSTFTRNISNQGGAVFSDSLANTRIRFSTFYGNRADLGGAIYRPLTGAITLGFSIVAASRNEDNTLDQLECDGPAYASLGYNLIEDHSCVDDSNATDIHETLPRLGALADNGGFSQSFMPNAGSPALNKIPAAQCLPQDQRTALRHGICDIGAVERGGLVISAYMPRAGK
jgi:hypothetical protein